MRGVYPPYVLLTQLCLDIFYKNRDHFITRSRITNTASQSLPPSRCFDSMSSEFTLSRLWGSKEYVSSLCLVASTDSHGLVVSNPTPSPVPFWTAPGKKFGVPNWRPSTLDVPSDVPSQCHREPSSEHVNRLSGFWEWNLMSQTGKSRKTNPTKT